MSAIAAFNRLSGHQRIGGQLVRAAEASISVIDPATEERIGEIAEATPAEIDQAVAAANTAQRAWRKVNYHRRAELLHEVSRRVMADRPLVAEMLTREMGKPYKESFDEVGWSASAIDYYAEIARHESGKVLGATVDGQFHFTTKDPLGVVVIILPFNYPLCLLCWQATAALASGNAVIIKPSDLTSLTTLQFVAAFDALPPGLVQVITGGGSAGKRLVEHPETHMVAFTGGIETGRRVAEACGRLYKRTLDRDFRQRSVHRHAVRARGHRGARRSVWRVPQLRSGMRRGRAVLRARAGVFRLHRKTGASHIADPHRQRSRSRGYGAARLEARIGRATRGYSNAPTPGAPRC